MECEDSQKQYIGETGRTLDKRFKEHTDGNHPSSAIQEHINLAHNSVILDHVTMCKEDNKTRRNVKEEIEIYKDGPALSRPQL